MLPVQLPPPLCQVLKQEALFFIPNAQTTEVMRNKNGDKFLYEKNNNSNRSQSWTTRASHEKQGNELKCLLCCQWWLWFVLAPGWPSSLTFQLRRNQELNGDSTRSWRNPCTDLVWGLKGGLDRHYQLCNVDWSTHRSKSRFAHPRQTWQRWRTDKQNWPST